jgi:hypothetical protein
MTSLLRRKHRTTRPSLRRMSESQELRVKGQEPERRIWRGSVALLAIAVCVSSANGASELKWRSERADATSRSTQSTSTPIKTSTSTTLKGSSFGPSGNALRFTRPQTSSTRVDTSVRLTAFEEDSPRLTSGGGSDTHTRSVVVNREDASDSFRSAQLPASGTGGSAAPSNSSSSSPTGDRLRSPFGDTTEPPPLETPQFDNLPGPKENTIPIPQEQRQPPTGTLDQQPTTAPPVGQFQPVLPSGPRPPSSLETGPPAPLTPTATIEAEKSHAKESCDKSLQNLRAYTVDKVNLSIGIKGTEGKDYPFECSIDDGSQFKGRCWDQTTYMWKASAMCHKPLYFEDEQLERYGHSFSPCFQPFISGAHFFCTLPVLPYCMGVEPPCECIYALGHYRPGSCAPYMWNPIPLSPRGALIEAGVVTGAAAALP